MAVYTNTLTTDTSVQICTVRRNRHLNENDMYRATFVVYGTWNGATVTMGISPDNGSTIISLKTAFNGDAITFSADGSDNIELTHNNTDDGDGEFTLHATMASASSSSVTIKVIDNTGP